MAKEKLEKTNEEIIEEKSSEEVENILENDNTSNENNIIEELQSNIRSLTDKNMRIQAEFANYKSRNEQEKTLMFKYEGEALIKQMLEVIDDFERAIKFQLKEKNLILISQRLYLLIMMKINQKMLY